MALLDAQFCGIRSPNPFWLASGPATDKAYNVERAFDAGWGGVVWKTLGDGAPIVNVSGPRYGGMHGARREVRALNNIELITDRPLEVNLSEIREVKRRWPENAVVVSVMAPREEVRWRELLLRVEATGADGVELNLGCPHGMAERGMGSAIGQVPELVEEIVTWCKTHTALPVIAKLTPNITDICATAAAARRGGADGVALINTINSIMGVDVDTATPWPSVDGYATHGGYCGPAVKPIALHMLSEVARATPTRGLPISGMGGIETWHDAAEFVLLGAGNLQVCTAAMTYGFRIIDELVSGLAQWMTARKYRCLDEAVGQAVPRVVEWQDLNLAYVVKARIDQESCIQCGRCYSVCEDTSHQAITSSQNGKRHFEVLESECVGCNLCAIVCPVDDCISMDPLKQGDIDTRTGVIVGKHMTWQSHPLNPDARDLPTLG